MVMRLALLASIAWLSRLTTPLFTVADHVVSARDLILCAGGIFLIWKASQEIFDTIEGESENNLANKSELILGRYRANCFIRHYLQSRFRDHRSGAIRPLIYHDGSGSHRCTHYDACGQTHWRLC